MKNLFLSLLFFSCLHLHAQEDTLRILFLGNSYTATNNLPSLITNAMGTLDITIISQSNTPGGFTFSGHDQNTTSNNLIQQGNWDYVVLQEQSQFPSFPIAQVESDCFPFAASLSQKAKQFNPCAQVVFYMTWGRQNGDSQNCPNWPPVCTYEGMDDLLYERYMTMAQDNQALVSPVGAVWRSIRTNYPDINLYSGDGSHPSIEGSYTAAITFATLFSQSDPTTITFNSTLSTNLAETIKTTVKSVVFDNLSQWNVGIFENTNPDCILTKTNEHWLDTEQIFGFLNNEALIVPNYSSFSLMEIFDLQGRLIYKTNAVSNIIPLEIPNGVYLIRGFRDNHWIQFKALKCDN